MRYANQPKIILIGFEKANQESYTHLLDIRSALIDALNKMNDRIHKSKAKFIIHPNKQHFRTWGTKDEMFIEFLDPNT